MAGLSEGKGPDYVPYKNRFEIDGLPPITSNGSFGNRWDHSKKMRRWRNFVVFAIGLDKPKRPLEMVKAHFVRHSSIEPDDDNLIISFKPVRDGLKDAGVVVDDNRKHFRATYSWKKAPPGKGWIEVEIEEVV